MDDPEKLLGPSGEFSEAELAIAFAFEVGGSEPDQTGEAAGLLLGEVSALQALPEGSDLSWSQGSRHGRRSSVVAGLSDKSFPDGSELNVTIREHVGPQESDTPLLAISLVTLHPTDLTKSVRVGYSVLREGTEVTCTLDETFGLGVQRVLEVSEQLDELDLDGEVDFEQILSGLLLEQEMIGEGLSPDLDSDIEGAREEDVAYRLVSDSLRSDHAAHTASEEMGMFREVTLSVEETQRLIAFLKSL